MIWLRVGLVFLGSLLIVFQSCRILWQFVRWGVEVIAELTPAEVAGDPRIYYRVEAVALAVGAALVFLGCILR